MFSSWLPATPVALLASLGALTASRLPLPSRATWSPNLSSSSAFEAVTTACSVHPEGPRRNTYAAPDSGGASIGPRSPPAYKAPTASVLPSVLSARLAPKRESIWGRDALTYASCTQPPPPPSRYTYTAPVCLIELSLCVVPPLDSPRALTAMYL